MGEAVFDFFIDHIFLALLVITVVMGFVICVPTAYIQEYQCSAKAKVIGTDYQYGFIKGCFIKIDNQWVDYQRYVNAQVRF